MAVPIAVLIAATVARALAKEAAKQGVKQLTKEQARVVARNSVSGIAKKRSLELSKSKALSGKNLDAAIIRANNSARSTKPVRNAQGLKTTTGQGKTKVTKGDVYDALKGISKSPSGGSGNISGVGTVRRVQAKPYVRVTTQTGRGKTTVQKPLKKTNPKEKGSALTVRKTTPRKASDVRAERDKANRDRLRGLLSPRVNPARPKTKPKSGVDKSSRDYNVEGKDTPQGVTIRGKFYPDGNPGLPARGNSRQGTIDSRVSDRAEKPTYGVSRRGEQGAPDSEADKLANSALRNLESPKAAAKNNKVKPGKPTKTTLALRRIGDKPSTKAARDAELKRIIRNQRKVLKQRALKEAGERTKLTKSELARIEEQVQMSDFVKLMRKQGK